MRWNAERARSRVRGCLAAAACGDAVGLARETSAAIGMTTDDTALTVALARSLAAIGIVEAPDDHAMAVIAEGRRAALRETGGFGWGTSTIAGTNEMNRWFDGHADGRAPWVEVPPPRSPEHGAGCGPAMQISPLGLAHALAAGRRPIDLGRWCRRVARMTHGNADAAIAAHAMALATSAAFSRGRRLEDGMPVEPVDRVRGEIVRTLRGQYPADSRVIAALDRIGRPAFLDSDAGLRDDITPGFFCWESVPFAIGTWMRHPDDPRGAIEEAAGAAVNADSVACMAGALAGACAGIASVPAEWIAGVSTVTAAIDAADRLLEAARLRPPSP